MCVDTWVSDANSPGTQVQTPTRIRVRAVRELGKMSLFTRVLLRVMHGCEVQKPIRVGVSVGV